MGRNPNSGRGGGRNPGRHGGGRGRGFSHKKTNKPQIEKKYMFTLLSNTADVRVSTHETTLKKVYEYLMQNIKNRPDDLVDGLKKGDWEEFKNPVPTVYTVVPKETKEEKAQEQLKANAMNAAYQMDWANEMQEVRN